MADDAAIKEKKVALVERLLAKTRRDEVEWERTSSPGTFQASFPSYSVIVFTRGDYDDREAMDYVLRIMDAEGTVIDEFADIDFRDLALGSSRNMYKLMGKLHDLARHRALGVNEAIDDLLSELGGEE